MEIKSSSQNTSNALPSKKTKIPSSVKFTNATRDRMRRVLESGVLKGPALLEFAMSNLLDQLDAGKEIRFAGNKLQLVRASHANGAVDDEVDVTLELAALRAFKASIEAKSKKHKAS